MPDLRAINARATALANRSDDPEVQQLTRDVMDLLMMLTSAGTRLQAVQFLTEMYGDEGEVPVDALTDALDGDMVIY